MITSVPFSAIIVTGIAVDRLCYAIWPFCHINQVVGAKIFVSLSAIGTLAFAIVSSFTYSVYRRTQSVELVKVFNESLSPIFYSSSFQTTDKLLPDYSSSTYDNYTQVDFINDAYIVDQEATNTQFIYDGTCVPSHVYLEEKAM